MITGSFVAFLSNFINIKNIFRNNLHIFQNNSGSKQFLPMIKTTRKEYTEVLELYLTAFFTKLLKAYFASCSLMNLFSDFYTHNEKQKY